MQYLTLIGESSWTIYDKGICKQYQDVPEIMEALIFYCHFHLNQKNTNISTLMGSHVHKPVFCEHDEWVHVQFIILRSQIIRNHMSLPEMASVFMSPIINYNDL